MKTLLKEPLLHFLLLGAAIFATYGLMPTHGATDQERIVVTQGRIEALATAFGRTWRRPPTVEELDGLIRDYVREEVSAREAIALGLDKDDTVIRRRLRQKLEFVSEDLAAQAEPTEDQLRAYLEAHPAAFRVAPRFTFRQVFLSPERRGENLSRDAAGMLTQLRQGGADAKLLGDSLLLDRQFDAIPADDVVKQFGEQFAARLAELPTREWQGPIPSGYGAHLVFVIARTEERLPPLEEVRDGVRREWANARRRQANDEFYAALLQRYTVIVEPPKPDKLAQAR